MVFQDTPCVQKLLSIHVLAQRLITDIGDTKEHIRGTLRHFVQSVM